MLSVFTNLSGWSSVWVAKLQCGSRQTQLHVTVSSMVQVWHKSPERGIADIVAEYSRVLPIIIHLSARDPRVALGVAAIFQNGRHWPEIAQSDGNFFCLSSNCY